VRPFGDLMRGLLHNRDLQWYRNQCGRLVNRPHPPHRTPTLPGAHLHSLAHTYGKNFNTALEVVDEQRAVCYVAERSRRSVVKVCGETTKARRGAHLA